MTTLRQPRRCPARGCAFLRPPDRRRVRSARKTARRLVSRATRRPRRETRSAFSPMSIDQSLPPSSHCGREDERSSTAAPAADHTIALLWRRDHQGNPEDVRGLPNRHADHGVVEHRAGKEPGEVLKLEARRGLQVERRTAARRHGRRLLAQPERAAAPRQGLAGASARRTDDETTCEGTAAATRARIEMMRALTGRVAFLGRRYVSPVEAATSTVTSGRPDRTSSSPLPRRPRLGAARALAEPRAPVLPRLARPEGSLQADAPRGRLGGAPAAHVHGRLHALLRDGCSTSTPRAGRTRCSRSPGSVIWLFFANSVTLARTASSATRR